MKIFFFTKSLSAGGAETQSSIIASGMKRKGYDVEFIVYSKRNADSRNLGRLHDSGVRVHELLWKRPVDLWRMYRLFNDNRDGALFSFTSFPNFIGGVIAKLAGMKRIYAGVRSEDLPRVHMAMERFLDCFIVAKTIFNSHRGRQKFIEKGFDSAKCETIPNAIERIGLSRMRQDSNNVHIITVGRFIESKDYYTWCKVVASVRQTYNNIEGVIIGYGPLDQQIRGWIEEMSLSDVVEIKKGNADIDIASELVNADIYLTTTRREGCCNSILEAMRAGLPIVATDAGDNSVMVRSGINGFVEKIADVENIAKHVGYLVFDKETRRAYGAASANIVKNEYAPEVVFSKYAKLLK